MQQIGSGPHFVLTMVYVIILYVIKNWQWRFVD
jgi:hypothetical protein